MSSILRPLRLLQRLQIASSSVRLPALLPHTVLGTAPPERCATFRQWYQSLWKPPQPTAAPYEHVTQIGDPVLRRRADPVPVEAITSPEIRFLADRMVRVMRSNRGFGLAAPQIGVSMQMIVMECTPEILARYSAEAQQTKRIALFPLTVLINPKVQVTNYERATFTEGCLSVRGYSADVARYLDVTVTGYDLTGELQTLPLSGWSARIAQHEIDHLNGVMYTDIMDPKTFACTIWQSVNAREGRVYIEFSNSK